MCSEWKVWAGRAEECRPIMAACMLHAQRRWSITPVFSAGAGQYPHPPPALKQTWTWRARCGVKYAAGARRRRVAVGVSESVFRVPRDRLGILAIERACPVLLDNGDYRSHCAHTFQCVRYVGTGVNREIAVSRMSIHTLGAEFPVTAFSVRSIDLFFTTSLEPSCDPAMRCRGDAAQPPHGAQKSGLEPI